MNLEVTTILLTSEVNKSKTVLEIQRFAQNIYYSVSEWKRTEMEETKGIRIQLSFPTGTRYHMS